jgi:hypothetical protein
VNGPPEAIQAAAEVMLRQYDRQYSSGHLTWRDFADDATEMLEAAEPHMIAVAEERFAAAAREELAKPLAELGAQIVREAAAAPHHHAAERERLKRVLGEAKEALAYPANGYLLDAVTWAHVLDALSPDPEGISDGT